MQNFIKTIINSVQSWTKKQIRQSTADWSQNDPNADNYVKNRTHWEERVRVTLVDNLTAADYSDGNKPQCTFIPGQKYDVIWNGVLYEDLVCYFDGEWRVIASENNGCPFYIEDDGGNNLYISADDDNWVVSITGDNTVVHKLDSKYLDLPTNLATTDDVQEAADGKMDANNPVGTGSFSMNRAVGSSIGNYSHAEGNNNIASGATSHAEGSHTTASGSVSHAEGWYTTASSTSSHAEGTYTSTSKDATPTFGSIIGGYAGQGAHAEGTGTVARATASHSEGHTTLACKAGSHAEGDSTIAASAWQHVQGKYNIEEIVSGNEYTIGSYAHIVGNGTSDDSRSNAHTLDWDGNAWYAGDVYVGSTSGINKDEGSKKLATEELVEELVAQKSQVQMITWEADD